MNETGIKQKRTQNVVNVEMTKSERKNVIVFVFEPSGGFRFNTYILLLKWISCIFIKDFAFSVGLSFY